MAAEFLRPTGADFELVSILTSLTGRGTGVKRTGKSKSVDRHFNHVGEVTLLSKMVKCEPDQYTILLQIDIPDFVTQGVQTANYSLKGIA
jgi:hypothetical protein